MVWPDFSGSGLVLGNKFIASICCKSNFANRYGWIMGVNLGRGVVVVGLYINKMGVERGG